MAGLRTVPAHLSGTTEKKDEDIIMKKKSLLFAVTVGLTVLCAATVSAETFTSSDGVISVETPDDGWVQTNDPNYWFTISDGKDTITIDHLSNGESLPAVQVADENYGAVYQAFVSTKNEVFVVKALAADAQDLESLMKMVGTIRVLKFDTKTAIQKSASPQVSEFGLKPVNADYYCTGSDVNVRVGCSTDEASLGTLSKGQKVQVVGAVTRNGEDYGWYQISFNGSTGFVSSGFLSADQPAAQEPAQKKSDSEPYQLADGFTCYDSRGNVQGLLRPYSDGLYYSNDMVAYADNGDGSYYSYSVGEYLYDYNPVSGSPDDAYAADKNEAPYQLAGGFTCYDSRGNVQGLLRPYSDGLYYSNDMVAYSDNGDGSYYSSAVGEYLYDYNPVSGNPDDAYASDY